MISPTHTLSPEWGNENALRAYPLYDDAPAAAVIPTWLIADLHVSVGSEYATVFVSSAYVSDTLVSVGISGMKSGSSYPEGLLVKTVTRDELEPFRAYAMERIDGNASGLIMFGEPPADAAAIKANFTATDAAIVPSAIARLQAPGVTAIEDKDHGVSASGIIDLSGNSEFRTYVDPTDATGQTIIIELTDIYRDLSTSVCTSTPSFNQCGATPVKTINGVAPDDNGVITIRFK